MTGRSTLSLNLAQRNCLDPAAADVIGPCPELSCPRRADLIRVICWVVEASPGAIATCARSSGGSANATRLISSNPPVTSIA